MRTVEVVIVGSPCCHADFTHVANNPAATEEECDKCGRLFSADEAVQIGTDEKKIEF